LLRGLPTVTRPDRRLGGIEINQVFRDEALLSGIHDIHPLLRVQCASNTRWDLTVPVRKGSTQAEIAAITPRIDQTFATRPSLSASRAAGSNLEPYEIGPPCGFRI